ncbi:MAG: NAD(P)-dependent alcohol dehydrogenase [Alphaproteobacteria bacterium]|nr:NAD(P)-dependent alcohol dehydrogenase [Alphaproteobacteria bacterium]
MLKTKAYAAPAAKARLAPFSLERRDPRDHDVVIDIRYCGICHTDIHQVRDEWGGSVFPMVPGHEITGVVTAVGPHVKKYKPGGHVGVGCMVDSCRVCDNCRGHMENYCTSGISFTYNSTEQDHETRTHGGYSDKIVVDEDFVLRIPDNLPLDGAAPLLCAGITLYSPLKHWKAGLGKKVAILGLGGLGHMGVKIAHALGAEVTVLSHSLHKKDDAKRLGADHFYATAEPATFEALKNSFDLIICTVGTGIDWNQYLGLLKRDATMVVVGVPESQVPVGAGALIGMRRQLAGSMIGGIRETQEMLDFCGHHGITSDIEVIPIQKVNEAFDRVVKSDVRYRFVIDMASLKAA